MKKKDDDRVCVNPNPKQVKTNTQVTLDDMETSPEKDTYGQTGVVSERQVDEDTVMVNPDTNSMGSRG